MFQASTDDIKEQRKDDAGLTLNQSDHGHDAIVHNITTNTKKKSKVQMSLSHLINQKMLFSTQIRWWG